MIRLSKVVGCGLWVVGCGLWVVGLWVVGCGLWVCLYVYRFIINTTLSPCHLVTLSPCHLVTLSPQKIFFAQITLIYNRCFTDLACILYLKK